jgi:hypothetical protein
MRWAWVEGQKTLETGTTGRPHRPVAAPKNEQSRATRSETTNHCEASLTTNHERAAVDVVQVELPRSHQSLTEPLSHESPLPLTISSVPPYSL